MKLLKPWKSHGGMKTIQIPHKILDCDLLEQLGPEWLRTLVVYCRRTMALSGDQLDHPDSNPVPVLEAAVTLG